MKNNKLIITFLLASYTIGASALPNWMSSSFTLAKNYFGKNQKTILEKAYKKDKNGKYDKVSAEKTVTTDGPGRKAIKSGVAKSIEVAISETTKEIYKNLILNPLIINPLKKVFGLNKNEKAKKEIAQIRKLREIMKTAIENKAPRKIRNAIRKQLLEKIKAMTDRNNKKK